MNIERILSLAETYGGDVKRWPESERAAATAWLADHPVDGQRVLFEARQTDAILDSAPRPAVSHELRQRVMAAASQVRPSGWSPLRRRPAAGAIRTAWWSSIGWATAACAGVVVGHGLMGPMAADLQADAVLYQASLTDVDDTEGLG